MNLIRVVNLKNYKPIIGEILIKVDRTSPVGNPFHMSSEKERINVCNKYDAYMEDILKSNSNLNKSNDNEFKRYIEYIISIARKSNIALGCWCEPKRCHAESIKKLIYNRLFIEESND